MNKKNTKKPNSQGKGKLSATPAQNTGQRRSAPMNGAGKRAVKVAVKRNLPQANRGYIDRWRRALLNPFAADALGIRTPNEYAVEATTRHITARVNLIGSASNVCAAAFMPSPLIAAIDGLRVQAGVDSLSTGQFIKPVNNVTCRNIVTPTTLQSSFENFRLVAGGLKLRVQVPQLTRTGNIIVAPIPTQRASWGWNALQNITVTSAAALGEYIGGFDPSNIDGRILNLPGAMAFSLNDLGMQDLILPFRPTSAAYTQFHGTSFDSAFGVNIIHGDGNTSGSVSGLSIAGGQDLLDLTDQAGWNCWVVYIDGIAEPAGTPIVSVEAVYHLEGTPAVSSAQSGLLVATNDPQPRFDVGYWHQVCADLKSLPWVEVASIGAAALGVMSRAYTGRKML